LAVCFEYRPEHEDTVLGMCVSSGGTQSDQCALKDRQQYTVQEKKTLGRSLDDNSVCEDTVRAVTLVCKQQLLSEKEKVEL
jgi:hypothetical protein